MTRPHQSCASVRNRAKAERWHGAAKTESFSGMGIGLYLSRLIVEGHGGDLAIESEGEDKGATVRVRLPLGGDV